MTSADAPISTPPGHRIEECFVTMLHADPALAGLPVVAGSNRDARVPPLHCFVLCSRVAPVLSVGQNYYADVAIVVAGNIDETPHAERREWATKVNDALTRVAPPFAVQDDACLVHWSIQQMTEVSSSQNVGDRIDLRVVAWVAAG